MCCTVGCAPFVAPTRPPACSESAARLAPGAFRVASTDVVFDDQARGRRLASTLWWPADAPGSAPLVVEAHGFLANRGGLAYVARHLAARGYVVIAATHPHTTLFARGGRDLADVVRQPGDVSFLIDRLLQRDVHLPPIPPIDPPRIAVMGHSLGGLTATLTAFHPRLRDSRIAAAISIAGPMAMLQPSFFRTAPVPFLMIAGSADVIVDYRRNAFVALDRVSDGPLVSIAGASHAGFDQTTAWLPRLWNNPDVPACWLLTRTLHLDAALATVRALVRADEGVDLDDGVRPPCLQPPPRLVMDPPRQQMITTLAVTAFLESRFARDPDSRMRAHRYLVTTMARELPEVSVATGLRNATEVGRRSISLRGGRLHPSGSAVPVTAKGRGEATMKVAIPADGRNDPAALPVVWAASSG